MIIDQFTRTKLILGEEGLCKLKNATVAVFGLGGVGSYTAEALARAGVGKLILVDGDTVCVTNINRQLPALHSTIGLAKVKVVAERIRDINPQVEVVERYEWFSDSNVETFFTEKLDCIVDAIDSVKAKTLLIETSVLKGIKIFSSMGTGNKLDCTKLVISDISKTHTCPLAKVMRKALSEKGIKNLTVVFSAEPSEMTQLAEFEDCAVKEKCTNWSPDVCLKKKRPPASVSFVPSVAGLMLAQLVVQEVCNSV